jgi:hypothetical protein
MRRIYVAAAFNGDTESPENWAQHYASEHARELRHALDALTADIGDGLAGFVAAHEKLNAEALRDAFLAGYLVGFMKGSPQS